MDDDNSSFKSDDDFDQEPDPEEFPCLLDTEEEFPEVVCQLETETPRAN